MINDKKPLAELVRPQSIDDMVGQSHLLGENKALYNLILSKNIPNLIFYGKSGTGKTTLSKLIAKEVNMEFCYINCTEAKIEDVRAVINKASKPKTLLDEIDKNSTNGKKVLLYLDEIQYFNKKQQQVLLNSIEVGDVKLIAATTENPYFYLYNALISRSFVFEFKEISNEDIVKALKKAILIYSTQYTEKQVSDSSLHKISAFSNGDVRRAINALEIILNGSNTSVVDDDFVVETLSFSGINFDKDGDDHYDLLSAYQKSMRGSDINASVYYLARLLESGDIYGAMRRLLVCASEDVGLSTINIIPIVKACCDSALELGMPEARIPLANATILVASAVKSNSAYLAINKALEEVKKSGPLAVPRQLQNKHFDSEEVQNKGQHYKYAHDYDNHYVFQQYLPDAIKDMKFYQACDNKQEQKIAEYQQFLHKNK